MELLLPSGGHDENEFRRAGQEGADGMEENGQAREQGELLVRPETRGGAACDENDA